MLVLIIWEVIVKLKLILIDGRGIKIVKNSIVYKVII